MSFFDDIKMKSIFGRSCKHTTINFGGEAVYIEGVKKIITLDKEIIIVITTASLFISSW